MVSMMRPVPAREDRMIIAQSNRTIMRMVPKIPPMKKKSQFIPLVPHPVISNISVVE